MPLRNANLKGGVRGGLNSNTLRESVKYYICGSSSTDHIFVFSKWMRKLTLGYLCLFSDFSGLK
jgi:hypothetical protein